MALPILSYAGADDVCSAWARVQNAGQAPTRAVLVVWGEAADCPGAAGPLGTSCSGLIAPGAAWSFVGPSMPHGAQNGFVYALADGSYGGNSIADTVCDHLAAISTDTGFRAFHAAYLGDGSVAGIPMAAARGEPLAVTVHRSCPADMTPGARVDSAYEGVSEAMFAARDSDQSPQYRYEVPLVLGDIAGMNTHVYVQNAGVDCATVELRFRAEDSCAPAAGGTGPVTIPAGQARSFDPTDHVASPWRGGIEVVSDAPLALAADVHGRDSLSTYRGVPAVPSPGAEVLFGPLYRGPATGWDTNVQVHNLGTTSTAARVTFHRADGTVEATLTDTLCAGAIKAFLLPVSFDTPILQAGWIQVEAECSGLSAPQPLAAVAWLLKYSDAQRSELREASAYNLLAAPELAAGTVALPFAFKDLSASGLTSEIQVAAGPEFDAGSTGTEDVGHTFADSAGTVAQYDLPLGAGLSTYENLGAMPVVPEDLQGAAVLDNANRLARYAAAGIVRSRTYVGSDIPGDEAAVHVGVPVGTLPAAPVPTSCSPPCVAPDCLPPAEVIPVRNLAAPPRLSAPVDCGVAPQPAGIGLVPDGCGGSGPRGPDLSAGSLQWGSGATVNVATGELIVSEVDLEIAGRGFDFRLERRYGSGADYDGPLGHGWDVNLGRRLLVVNAGNAAAYGAAVGALITPGDVLRMDGTGRAEVFRRQPDDSYIAPEGSFAVLQTMGAGLVERDAAGAVATFGPPDAAGIARMTAVADRAGNTMRFTYDGDGRMTRVLDTLGRSVDFSYDAQDRLIAVRDFAGRQVSYGYDANGDLVTVTTPAVVGTSTGNDFPAGKTTRFAYASGSSDPAMNHNLMAVTAPNEVAAGGPPRLAVEYDGADRVTRFTTGGTNASGIPAGGSVTYAYAGLSPSGPPVPDPVVSETQVVDANGNRVHYGLSARGQVREAHRLTNRDIRPDEPHAYVDRYSYDAEGRMVRHERPAGNAEEYVYDSANPERRQQGNLLAVRAIADATRGADQDEIVTTYRYEPMFNQVEAVVDPRGHGPYTPPNGGVASPARYTTRLTFDYQEGDNAAALGQLLGLPEAAVRAQLAAAGIALGLGDVNGDGLTNQVAGKVVRIERPTVTLEPAGPLAQRLGTIALPSFELFGYNRYGQLVYQMDAEGNLDRYEYHPENDPDGDGRDQTAGLGNDRFGYLAAVTRDAAPRAVIGPPFSGRPPLGGASPGEPRPPAWRNGGGGGGFAGIRDELRYDRAGHVVRHTGPRGVVDIYEVNALGQVVSLAQAAAVTVSPANVEEPAWFYCRDATLPECSAGMVAFNVRARFHYDANDNLVRAEVEDRGGAGLAGPWVEARYEHDILDHVLSEALEVTEGVFTTSRLRYDRAGHAVLALSPLTGLPVGDPDRQPAHVEGRVYDERGLVASVTRGGLTGQFRSLDAHADIPELAAVPDAPERATVDLAYDANGQLASQADAVDSDGDGRREVTRYVYDGLDRLQSVVNPVGTQWLLNHDPAGHAVRLRVFGPTGGPSPSDDSAATLDPPLGTASFGQPLLGESLVRVNERGEAYLALDRLFAYDDVAYARPPVLAEGAADAPGDGWVETWQEADRADRLVAYREDDGNSHALAYDGDDRLVRHTDPEGNSVAHSWDDAGNAVRTTTTEVTRAADVAAGVAPRLTANYTVVRVFDALDRLIRVTDNLGNAGRWQYDSRGHAVRITNAQHSTRATDLIPDPLGLFPSPAVSAPYGYRINRPGNVTARTFDGLGRLVRETRELRAGGQGMGAPDTTNPANPDGLVTLERAYDDADRLTTLTDDLGQSTRLGYDALDRLVRAAHADGTEVRSDYDLDGNAIRHVDPNGSEVRVTFDAADRPVAVDVTRGPGVVGTTRQTQAFDGLGRMTESTDNNEPLDPADDSRLTLAYDSLGRVLDEVSGGRAVSSRWSGDGKRRLALVYPDGRTITYGRDKLDLVTRVVDADGTRLAQYRRIGPGRLLERPLANGVIWTMLDDARRLATGLDSLGRVIRQRHLGAANQLVVGTTYGYDRQWVPTFEGKLHAASFGESYAQDSLARLVTFQRGTLNTVGAVTGPAPAGLREQTWRLDGAGNWAETQRTLGAAAPAVETRSHSPRNAVTTAGAATLTSDANGALLADGARNLAWDYAGRLRQVALPSGQVLSYAYDGPGRRVARTTTGGSVAAGTTRYTFDGWREIEERSAAGALLAQNVFGAWLDEPVARDRDQNGDGTVTGPLDLRLFYHPNTQYSVHGVTNRQGKLVEGYLYDPYGRPTVYTPGANGRVDFGGDDGVAPGGSSGLGNPFLYTGRPWDAATGLYDLRRRQLDPNLGRFVSPDPLGAWGDPANLGSAYAYVAGRPHWGLDPMGLGGYTKGYSNIRSQSAGDPIPGVDVNLDQIPGSNLTAQSAGPGDPIPNVGVGLEIFPPGGSMTAQSAGPGDPIKGVGVGLEIFPPGGNVVAQSTGNTGAGGFETFSKFSLANRAGGANPLSVAPSPGSTGNGIRAFSKFSLSNRVDDVRVFSKFSLANRAGSGNVSSLRVARPQALGVCPAPISIDEEGVSSK